MAERDGPPAATPGVRGFDHVAISVPDLASARLFFVAAFGAEVVFEIPRFSDVEGGALTRLGADRQDSLAITMLRIGDTCLELLEWSAPEGSKVRDVRGEAWPAPQTLGCPHVAIDVGDLRAALESLRGFPGVTVIGEPLTFDEGPTPGLANAFVTAPWGLLVELVCWTRGRPSPDPGKR